MSIRRSKILTFICALLVSILLIFTAGAGTVGAGTANTAKISFTFDDGYLNHLNKAAPTLQKYGYKGTAYITTSCVGSRGTCLADTGATYMNWNQVLSLKNNYGWEIGAHGHTHTPMSTLSSTRKQQEIAQSQAAFAARGLSPTSYASPEGDYDPATLALAAKNYTSHRGFHDTGYNVYPYNDYILRVQQVQVGVTTAQVKGYIDQAKASNQWLILVFHDIQDTPNPDPQEYEYATADLDAIAAYAKVKALQGTNITEGLISGSTNLVANGSFTSNLTGWSTDSSANVTIDSAGNGSVPESSKSVKITANASKTVHLFAPSVSVNPNDIYAIKNYIKLTQRSNSDVSYYIDEYDSFGNWISGQYKGSVSWLFPEKKTFTYKPTSSNVSKARLQVIVPAASGITVFLDNFEWFSSTGAVVTPPPAPTNILANPSFDNGMVGWSTDSTANVIHDNTGKGSPENPVNSVKLISKTAGNAHLFSNRVSVTFGQSYQLSCYLFIQQNISGYVGFYIDEYDQNGNWISGRYMAERAVLGVSNVAFSYSPSSVAVKSASIQVIVGAGGLTGYIDNILWLKP